MNYYVHSEDGRNYRVGRWSGGVWIPGSREEALANARSLREAAHDGFSEPTAYVLGITA